MTNVVPDASAFTQIVEQVMKSNELQYQNSENNNSNEEQNIYFDELEIRQSTELIPDEYWQEGKHVLVHIFCDQNNENTKKCIDIIKEALCDVDYIVRDEHIHDTKTQDGVRTSLANISDSIDDKVDGLLIIYLCTMYKPDSFVTYDKYNINTRDIWSKFTYGNCRGLGQKPKVFMILPVKKIERVETDSKRLIPKYDVPSEADMLILYKVSDSDAERQKYIEETFKNFSAFGKRDDLVTILTRSSESNRRSVLVSTMIKKYYILPSVHRGYRYDLHSTQMKINAKINDIITELTYNVDVESKSRLSRKQSLLKSTTSAQFEKDTLIRAASILQSGHSAHDGSQRSLKTSNNVKRIPWR